MQQDGDQDGGNISIGEEDQLRDRKMVRALQDEDGQQDDLLDPARRQHTLAARPAPEGPDDPARKDEDDRHPGDDEQPDRSASEGLTGSGPAQPDP